MSLEILLEAAKYLDSSEAKARGEDLDYTSYIEERPSRGHQTHYSREHSYKIDLTNSLDRSDYPYDPRDKRRLGGAGTREVHNKLEKNRRAHLKECFEMLKKQLPSMEERKTSNLSILRGALRYIQILKRKEREYEHEMEKLAREKIASQQRLAYLKKELSSQLENIDISAFLPDHDNETTTTASECGMLSDGEEGTKKLLLNERPVSPDSASLSSSTSSPSSDAGNSDQGHILPSICPPKQNLSFVAGGNRESSKKVTLISKQIGRTPVLSSGVATHPTPVLTALSVSNQGTNSSAACVTSIKQNIATKSTAQNRNSTASSSKTFSSSHVQLSPQVVSQKSVVYSNTSTTIGMLSGSQHGIQVINHGTTGVKLIAAQQGIRPSTILPSQDVHVISQAASSLVAMAASVTSTVTKPVVTHSLIKFPQSGKGTILSPVTLVPSGTVIPQHGNSKPLILNQAIALPCGRKTLKAQCPATQFNAVTTSANGITYVQPKMASHILQAVSQKALVNAVGQSPITTVGRQLITTIKPNDSSIHNTGALSRITQLTQLLPQGSTSVAHQLVATGTTFPVGASVSVNQKHLGKVLLKSVNPVPLIPQPILRSSGPKSGAQSSVMKPVVVVSVANSANTSGQEIVSVPLTQ